MEVEEAKHAKLLENQLKLSAAIKDLREKLKLCNVDPMLWDFEFKAESKEKITPIRQLEISPISKLEIAPISTPPKNTSVKRSNRLSMISVNM